VVDANPEGDVGRDPGSRIRSGDAPPQDWRWVPAEGATVEDVAFRDHTGSGDRNRTTLVGGLADGQVHGGVHSHEARRLVSQRLLRAIEEDQSSPSGLRRVQVSMVRPCSSLAICQLLSMWATMRQVLQIIDGVAMPTVRR
jgi:hypothetical protein